MLDATMQGAEISAHHIRLVDASRELLLEKANKTAGPSLFVSRVCIKDRQAACAQRCTDVPLGL